MNDDERKDLELRAFGKRITFHTRHHWILTWIEEQPGRNLADKVWNIIDRAYRADYAERGHQAMRLYARMLNRGTYPALDYAAMAAALCEACECYGCAGLQDREEMARRTLYDVLAAQANHVTA